MLKVHSATRIRVYTFKVRGRKSTFKPYLNQLSYPNAQKWPRPNTKLRATSCAGACRKTCRGISLYFGIVPFQTYCWRPPACSQEKAAEHQSSVPLRKLGHAGKTIVYSFDSVTLYGNDPATVRTFMGKLAMPGVSICCLDDAKNCIRLWSKWSRWPR